MTNDAESAGWIAAAVTAFICAALKLRTVMSGDKRKIAHDENTTKWESSLLQENEALRKQIQDRDAKNEETWLRHVEDGRRIAQLETELHYVREEVGRQRAVIARLEQGEKK